MTRTMMPASCSVVGSKDQLELYGSSTTSSPRGTSTSKSNDSPGASRAGLCAGGTKSLVAPPVLDPETSKASPSPTFVTRTLSRPTSSLRHSVAVEYRSKRHLGRGLSIARCKSAYPVKIAVATVPAITQISEVSMATSSQAAPRLLKAAA